MFTKSNFAVGSLAAVLVLFAANPVTAQISLGSAQSFGVLGGSAVTNTGASTVNANVGVSPGSSVGGFPPGVVVGGAIHSNDAVALQAQSDLTTAYNDVASTPCTADLTGQNLGGLTLTPGVYCFNTSAQLTGTLTLDSLGNPNALFLFKTGSTLTTASGSSVIAINPSNSCNRVFWQIGSSATLGTGTSFAGDILALTSITLTTGANTSGRVLARNGAVTLDTNNVNSCPALTCPSITVNPASLPPGSVSTPYNAIISASGGSAPYVFTISSGALPTGLLLNSTTGAITGSPTAAGTFNFTITATDTSGCSGTRPYSINIANAGCSVILLSPATLPPGQVGAAYSQAIIASGGSPAYGYTVSSGTLPAGLTLHSSTGVLDGVPLLPGVFSFTIRATDSQGCQGARSYTMTIIAAPPAPPAPGAPMLDSRALLILIGVLGMLGALVISRR
jgi:hypothetical protein